jgi:tRNA(Ile)-lysidine synthase
MTARYGFNQAQIADLLNCLTEPAEKTFSSSSHRITKERDRLMVSKIEIKPSDSVFYVDFSRDGVTINDPIPMQFQVIKRSDDFELFKGQDYANLDLHKLEFPLILRKWQHGDLFHPFGMKGKKRLSDYFTDLKFSTRQKEDTWLLCSGEKIAWVVGCRIDHRFRITSATNEILQINLPKFAPSKSN